MTEVKYFYKYNMLHFNSCTLFFYFLSTCCTCKHSSHILLYNKYEIISQIEFHEKKFLVKHMLYILVKVLLYPFTSNYLDSDKNIITMNILLPTLSYSDRAENWFQAL